MNSPPSPAHKIIPMGTGEKSKNLVSDLKGTNVIKSNSKSDGGTRQSHSLIEISDSKIKEDSEINSKTRRGSKLKEVKTISSPKYVTTSPTMNSMVNELKLTLESPSNKASQREPAGIPNKVQVAETDSNRFQQSVSQSTEVKNISSPKGEEKLKFSIPRPRKSSLIVDEKNIAASNAESAEDKMIVSVQGKLPASMPPKMATNASKSLLNSKSETDVEKALEKTSSEKQLSTKTETRVTKKFNEELSMKALGKTEKSIENDNIEAKSGNGKKFVHDELEDTTAAVTTRTVEKIASPQMEDSLKKVDAERAKISPLFKLVLQDDASSEEMKSRRFSQEKSIIEKKSDTNSLESIESSKSNLNSTTDPSGGKINSQYNQAKRIAELAKVAQAKMKEDTKSRTDLVISNNSTVMPPIAPPRKSKKEPERLKSLKKENNKSFKQTKAENDEMFEIDPKKIQLKHRGRIVEEIISSEKVFHGLLLDFLECYYVALSAEREQAAMDFMSRSSLVGLCSNIEQIAAVSGQMISELDSVSMVVDDIALSELGEFFLSISSLLKLYGQYAENHSAARHDLRDMIRSPSFRAFWDRTETDAMLGRSHGGEVPRVPTTSATLDGYLILPIQRVPRYLLLLRELLKNTPEEMGNERKQLVSAIEEVENAAKFMNDCIWRAEQKEILRDLQAKFVGTVVDFIGGVGIAGYRALIMEGELVRVTSKNAHRAYHFHLMNDAIVYSRANGSGGFRFHKALSLTGTCSVVESPPIANQAYEIYTANSKSNLSCAFKICTPEKSFIVYATTPELKRKWMDEIGAAIKAQLLLEEKASAKEKDAENVAEPQKILRTNSSKAEAVSAPTLQSASDKCQMCRSQLFIFTRRINCERCGLLVCGTCGSNQRVLPGKHRGKQLRITMPVCCACAWEMDGTAVDSFVDEFRLKVWVEDVQSLVGGVGGHAILESTDGNKKSRHTDATEALKRLYFSVSLKHRGEDQYRGPSNAGAMGADSSFTFPLGLPSDDSLPPVTLHVHMVGVGEIGRVPIRCENLISQPEVVRAQPFYKWHVVAPSPGTFAVSTLAVTLIQSNNRDQIHSRLSEKERGALRIGLKLFFELHVPPSLWGSHFIQGLAPTSMRSRTSSVTTNRPGVSKAITQSGERNDEVSMRLKRYMSMDDPAFIVGGTKSDNFEAGLRAKLNVSLLTEYERRVIMKPTNWGLTLTNTLYSDCLAHYGFLASNTPSRYADTQLTLLNRLRIFHEKPEIYPLLQELSNSNKPDTSASTPRKGLDKVPDVLLQAQKRQAFLLEERRPSRMVQVSLNALLGQQRERAKSKEKGEDEEEEQKDEDDRQTILRQLYETEKTYLDNLVILDEVFVSRLLQVAQGADIRLATLKQTDVWAQKMGLSEKTPTMTTGIQVMNTGLIRRAKAMLPISPNKLKFLNSSLNNSASNLERKASMNGNEDEDDGPEDVASVLKQPSVTVLLQSVRQIRTVNQEFFNSLSQRLNSKKNFSEEVCVGDILERFAGVMPVYSTYASHHPFVLEELTTARNDMDWDARWSLGARANSKALDSLITACEGDSRCEGKNLKFFLNIPLERIDTYQSALSALLMCTPRSHPDWNRMRLALGKIVESTKHMMRAIRKRENLDRLREIEAIVEDWPEGFNLIDARRWLVREGCLIERQTFAKRETHRARYFWLFSDCIVMATKISRVNTLSRLKSWGSAELLLTGLSSTVSTSSETIGRKYRFKRLIQISDMTICDLPHGVQSSTSGMILGDPNFAFCIASVSSPSFVALIPNNPTDCCSKTGPAPVELSRVGPPATYGIATTSEAYGRAPVLYMKAAIKNAWISDILLCIELFQRKAVFDDDEGIHSNMNNSNNAPVTASETPIATTVTKPRVESEFAIENPVFSPVKISRRRSSSSWRQSLSKGGGGEDEETIEKVVEKEEF